MMFILLVASTESSETMQDIIGLSLPLSNMGHKVVVFFNEESVNLLEKRRYEFSLIPVGIRLKVCRTIAIRKGLTKIEDLIFSAEMSSLGELVNLLEEADRTVFLR